MHGSLGQIMREQRSGCGPYCARPSVGSARRSYRCHGRQPESGHSVPWVRISPGTGPASRAGKRLAGGRAYSPGRQAPANATSRRRRPRLVRAPHRDTATPRTRATLPPGPGPLVPPMSIACATRRGAHTRTVPTGTVSIGPNGPTGPRRRGSRRIQPTGGRSPCRPFRCGNCSRLESTSAIRRAAGTPR